MFRCLDSGRPSIRCHQDKTAWSHSFHELIELRQAGTIGQVIDFLRAQAHMRIPEAVIDREDRLAALGADPVEGEPRRVTQLRRLREVPYTELMAVDALLDGPTPFATKHGVQGADFAKDFVTVAPGSHKKNLAQLPEWKE